MEGGRDDAVGRCLLHCTAYITLLCTMLSYAMLYYAMLSYAMLCYAQLCHAILCYAMLCYAVLCYAMRTQFSPLLRSLAYFAGLCW